MTMSSRHVVISGGGGGVGAEIAKRFAAEGAKVTILGRRQAPLDEIAALTGALALPCDVTDAAAVSAAIERAAVVNGPVDIAIANAGAAESVPFAQMTGADLDAALAVNLKGVVHLWQSCLPAMKAQRWGRLIAVASTAGLKGYRYVTGYVAAKHAVVGLTRALALELASAGITVNALCPGFIETPMLERSLAKIVAKTGMSPEAAAVALKADNPQKRFIQTDEVASAALWLCSEGARSVTGHALSISGGEV